MKKFFPLYLILIVALIWTVTGASSAEKADNAIFTKQVRGEKAAKAQPAAIDEMTPEKAARIRADKEARHEEILRSLAGEGEISAEKIVEYPPDATSNVGPAVSSSEYRMRQLKADGVIDADERVEYERLLAETPVVELPVPFSIVSESEPNDDCASADPIACGDTVWCATQDSTVGDNHDWFIFTLDSTYSSWNVVIETHPTAGACDPASSDTYLELWSGDCQTIITYNDDSGVNWFSLIEIILPPGTYAIHEDNSIWYSNGSYHLSVLCAEYAPCIENCPPNAFIENEPVCENNYEDTYNGGCNSVPPVFQYIDCGDTVCGELGNYLYWDTLYQEWVRHRDTDWYEFTTTTTMDITLTGLADADFLMYLIDAGSGDCSDYVILESGLGDPCSTVTFAVSNVPPGTYYAWAAPSVFSGWPCGSKYWFTVDCVETIGRCCYNNDLDCADITEDACNALGGNWDYTRNCIDDPCTCPEDEVVIEIFTDGYPGETTWDLVDQYSTVIATGGPYSDSATLYIEEICVEDTSCLLFTIYDAFGDGICCEYGNGFYNIYFNDLLQGAGGAFGDSESVGPFGTGCGVLLGRCCYGDPYNPSCVDNEQDACDALGGTWTYGLNCTDNPCPAIPANDSCNGAITVAVPSDTPGSTLPATPDTMDCVTDQYANSVWYKVVGTGNTITASLCDSNTTYDTKLQVWCNTCTSPMCVDGNDDDLNCTNNTLLSTVTWCSEQGTEYLILVGGFMENSGDFVLSVSDDDTSCSTPPNCTPPIGRCCYNNDQDCDDITLDACTALGGYWNEFMNCTDNPCLCPTGQDKIIVDLTTDFYPSEITWEIYDRAVGLIAFGGPYPDANTNYIHEICVDQGGCYDWYIYDSFGDGGGPYDLYYAGALVYTGDGNYGDGEHVYDIGNIGCGDPTGACCFADQSCADLTESDCIAQGGVLWQIYELCANVTCPELPTTCNDTLVVYSNGTQAPVISEYNVAQCDVEYPIQFATSDDFELTGTDSVDIGSIVTWMWHWNGNTNGPGDYDALNVAIYENDTLSVPGTPMPGGNPIDGDTTCAHVENIPGGIVYYATLLPGEFPYTPSGPDLEYRLEIPVEVRLAPGVKYWLEVQPVVRFSQGGQAGLMNSTNQTGEYAMRYAPLFGDDPWTTQSDLVDLAFCLLAPGAAGGCDYTVGDVNGSNSYNGLDVTYGVNFFKLGTPAPQCDPDCPPCAGWNYCGDVNASCNYNGLDITYGVNYFKLGSPAPIPCADCPPIGPSSDNPIPEMPQVIKSKTVNQNGTGLK